MSHQFLFEYFLLQNGLKSMYCAYTVLCKGKKKEMRYTWLYSFQRKMNNYINFSFKTVGSQNRKKAIEHFAWDGLNIFLGL